MAAVDGSARSRRLTSADRSVAPTFCRHPWTFARYEHRTVCAAFGPLHEDWRYWQDASIDLQQVRPRPAGLAVAGQEGP